MQKRTTCRKHYIALRNELSQETVATKSIAICKKILESPEYNEAQIILAYYPFRNSPFLRAADVFMRFAQLLISLLGDNIHHFYK